MHSLISIIQKRSFEVIQFVWDQNLQYKIFCVVSILCFPTPEFFKIHEFKHNISGLPKISNQRLWDNKVQINSLLNYFHWLLSSGWRNSNHCKENGITAPTFKCLFFPNGNSRCFDKTKIYSLIITLSFNGSLSSVLSSPIQSSFECLNILQRCRHMHSWQLAYRVYFLFLLLTEISIDFKFWKSRYTHFSVKWHVLFLTKVAHHRGLFMSRKSVP